MLDQLRMDVIVCNLRILFVERPVRKRGRGRRKDDEAYNFALSGESIKPKVRAKEETDREYPFRPDVPIWRD
jgi:hypothetical protein